MISLPIILILIFFGELLIVILFGKEYLPAYPILMILCMGQFCNVIMGSVGLVLNMTNNEGSALIIIVSVFFINLISIFILIPLYGEIGAALSVSIGQILINVITAIKVRQKTTLKTWIQ